MWPDRVRWVSGVGRGWGGWGGGGGRILASVPWAGEKPGAWAPPSSVAAQGALAASLSLGRTKQWVRLPGNLVNQAGARTGGGVAGAYLESRPVACGLPGLLWKWTFCSGEAAQPSELEAEFPEI